jgi:hypothetical protein
MKEIRRMPKAKDNEIVVGSELGYRSPDGVTLYRVIKVVGDAVTTVDIFRGPVSADQEPFEWSQATGSVASRAIRACCARNRLPLSVTWCVAALSSMR